MNGLGGDPVSPLCVQKEPGITSSNSECDFYMQGQNIQKTLLPEEPVN